jgi:serine protease Do
MALSDHSSSRMKPSSAPETVRAEPFGSLSKKMTPVRFSIGNSLPRLTALSLLCSLSALTLQLPNANAQNPAPEKIETPEIKVDSAPVQTKPGFINSFAPIVEKVGPSVVTISTSKNVKNSPRNHPMLNDPYFRKFFGLPEGEEDESESPHPPKNNGGKNGSRPQAMGLGSGVIISADGHILTNNHVVQGADDIEVTLGGNSSTRKYKAKKVAGDAGTDIAVLKIEANDLQPIVFGDSDKIRVGDIVVAVGNPFGLTQSVSMGVVSALGRGDMGIVDYENFIQTDASINPGNSGGALVDIEGRLIGINTAIYSRTGGNQGIGFAVPANLAHSTMDSLLKHGRVVRGYLGIGIQPLSEDLAQKFNLKEQAGTLVTHVESSGPSAKAGIKTGDVILEVSGKKVDGPRELRLLVSSMNPGASVPVKLVRDGKMQILKVQLGEMPSKAGAPSDADNQTAPPDVLDGVEVQDISNTLRKELEIPENMQGVVITAVDPDSASAAAGLKRGDVIHEIEREPVTNAKQAEEISEKIKEQKKVLLRVSRAGQSRYVVVTAK